MLVAAFAVGACVVAIAAGAGEYAGSDACLTCHEDAAASLKHYGAGKADPNCEGCHGPGAAHVDSGGDASDILQLEKASADERSATCTSCHVGGSAVHWPGSEHEMNDVACTDCHAVHTEHGRNAALLKEDSITETCTSCHAMAKQQMLRSAHMPVREDKMSCVSCHNPHGSPTDGMIDAISVNDSCYSCHAEKRGPVLHEHAPVRENCLSCHDPHGSIHESMLIAKQPRLCQNCHIHQRHPSEPRGSMDSFAFNTSCLQCHSQIHGSNHPSGRVLMR